MTYHGRTGWFCVATWHKLASSERKEPPSGEKMPPWDSAVRPFVSYWSMAKAQLTVGGTICGLEVLVLQESRQQAIGNKAVSGTPPWPVRGAAPASGFRPSLSSCPDFLQYWTAMWTYKVNKPFPPQGAFWSWCLVGATDIPRWTDTKRREKCWQGCSHCAFLHVFGFFPEKLSFCFALKHLSQQPKVTLI